MRETDDFQERVRLISAFTSAGIPLLVLNALFMFLAWRLGGSTRVTAFAGSTFAGLALLIRLQRTSLSRDQAARHGVAGLLLLLVPYIIVVWAWQSPRQLLLGW